MDSIKTFHGIRVIQLKGSSEERAIQHGKLLASMTADERSQLAFTPLSKKNQFLIGQVTQRVKGVSPVLGKFYEAFVLERFLSLPKKYKNRLKPFAKASKFPERMLWLSLYQPDFLMVLAAISSDRVRSHLMPGMPGCSTGIYRDHDSMLFLRNLDYPAAAHWERFPTVLYVEPTEPGLLNYVSITSLGIHTPGLTGFNEAGIAFSLHAQFSKKVNLKGAPIFFLGEDILEKARTLDEAIEICKQFKSIGNWTVNLASFKENKAVSVEISDRQINARSFDDSDVNEYQSVAHANGFQCPAFQKNELHFSGSVNDDVISRKAVLDHTHVTTVIEGLNALASHIDPTTNETRIFGNTLSVVTTIQSVVIDPKQNAFYVSNREESPTPLGPYVKLPFRFEDIPSPSASDLISPSVQPSPEFLSALHAYHHAYINWQVFSVDSRQKRSEIAHAYLLEATETLPNDPHLWMQRGYFELMHHEPKTALHCFETALSFAMSAHHQKVATYFKANCLDLLGERANAVRHYGEVLSDPQLDSKLAKKARNRLEKPFKRAYCQKIEPDLQFVEPLEYL